MIQRTNNPVESFNRRFAEMFTVKHPSMQVFVEGIHTISDRYLTDMRNIRTGLDQAPKHLPVHFAKIPPEYTKFKPSTAKK